MALVIYTVQMAQWRLCKARGIELIDTTVKSGDPVFAPTWEMVRAIKAGEITDEQYTELYREHMRQSWIKNKQAWLDLLKRGEIAIACYCKAGKFCHRHLLIEYLVALCKYLEIEYTLGGEICKA